MVSKTGRAEISEDPMGPEQTDVFIMLKPREQWGTGRDKAELVEAIQADLAEIPGLRYSFSQPIALRVNELISGVKSDLAVKVFGPDLEVLKDFADRAAAAMRRRRGRRRTSRSSRSPAWPSSTWSSTARPWRATASTSADVNDTIETAVAGQPGDHA